MSISRRSTKCYPAAMQRPGNMTQPATSLVSDLAVLAAGSDTAAWERVVQAGGSDMAAVTCRLAPDQDVAEDALQEAFLQIRTHASGFRNQGEDPEATARSWLKHVAANAVFQVLRARRRRRSHERGSAMAPGQDAPPETALEREELVAQVRRAVEDLPDRYRMPIVLFHLLGMDVRSVSWQLDLPQGTTKARLMRGRDLLRRRLVHIGPVLALLATWMVCPVQAAAREQSPAGGRPRWRPPLPGRRRRSTPLVAGLVLLGCGLATWATLIVQGGQTEGSRPDTVGRPDAALAAKPVSARTPAPPAAWRPEAGGSATTSGAMWMEPGTKDAFSTFQTGTQEYRSFQDGGTTYQVVTRDGASRLEARDAAGNLVFAGPIDSTVDRARLPPAMAETLSRWGLGATRGPAPTFSFSRGDIVCVISLERQDLRLRVTRAGTVMFEGPVTTLEQQVRIPEEVFDAFGRDFLIQQIGAAERGFRLGIQERPAAAQ